jgi:hypothetical protein
LFVQAGIAVNGERRIAGIISKCIAITVFGAGDDSAIAKTKTWIKELKGSRN